MNTSVIPQSRSEQILAATINGEEYNQPPQSRIEQLLIELKEAVEEGGGGGGGTTNYNALSNKPAVNGVTLSGDKSLADLGIMTEINNVIAMISGTFDATAGYSKDDVVIYDEKLYQFNTDHAAGAWDSTEVDQVTVTDLFSQSSGSGGGIALKKIWENPNPLQQMRPGDITIPSVANYDKLIMFYAQYDSGDGANNVAAAMFLKDHPTDITWVFGSNDGAVVRRRDISITDDTIMHVGNCKTATGTTAQSSDNNANIPLILYAIDEHSGGTIREKYLDYKKVAQATPQVYITTPLDKTMVPGLYYEITIYDVNNNYKETMIAVWNGTTTYKFKYDSCELEVTETTAGLTYYSGSYRNIYCDIISIGSTSDYNLLINQPSVNGVTLVGNKTLNDLGISVDEVNTFAIPANAWTANAGSDAANFPYEANITTDKYSATFIPAYTQLLGADATDYPTAADETAIGVVDKYVKFTGTVIRLRAKSAPATSLNLVVRG